MKASTHIIKHNSGTAFSYRKPSAKWCAAGEGRKVTTPHLRSEKLWNNNDKPAYTH